MPEMSKPSQVNRISKQRNPESSVNVTYTTEFIYQLVTYRDSSKRNSPPHPISDVWYH